MSRSTTALAIRASENTLVHSPNGRLVVTISAPRSWLVLASHPGKTGLLNRTSGSGCRLGGTGLTTSDHFIPEERSGLLLGGTRTECRVPCSRGVFVFQRPRSARREVPLRIAARDFCHEQLGPDHPLLGLIRERQGVAARVLGRFGVTEGRVTSLLLELRPRGEPPGPAELPFEAGAQSVVELSLDEALNLGWWILTQHLLMALARLGIRTALSILDQLRVD